MSQIQHRLQIVQQRIHQAADAAGRDPASIRLLAVSKQHSAEVIRRVAEAGQYAFGESYQQEASAKIAQLSAFPLEWHFIGPIQSNKTAGIAGEYAWVHSVDRLKIAQRLNAQRPAELPRLHICLQVNTSGEASKSGVEPAALMELATRIAELPRLQLRGLMTIPARQSDPAQQRRPFALLRQCRDQLNDAGMHLDTLSMGMSDDLEAAIMEGATIVRIGTAIFGPRSAR